jgi:DNA-binding transcriptional ArsR family regulator
MQAEFCKGMAHPKRIRILRELRGGEKSVSDLAKRTALPQANVSQHLALLRRFGLLSSRREGNNVYYAISDHTIVEACELVRSFIAKNLSKSQVLLMASP